MELEAEALNSVKERRQRMKNTPKAHKIA